MSLIECCTAAVVITATLAIAAPSLSRTMDAYKVRSAASGVAARIHAARIAAITRACDCRITVTSAASYLLECDDGGWHVIERLAPPAGVTVEANARPEFHRRGNVVPTATFTVRNRYGTTRKVIVNVNGRVRMQ